MHKTEHYIENFKEIWPSPGGSHVLYRNPIYFRKYFLDNYMIIGKSVH